MNEDKMRKEFEAWAMRMGHIASEIIREHDGYTRPSIHWQWQSWQAATRAAIAKATEGQSMPIDRAAVTGAPLLLYWRGVGWMRGRYVVDDLWDIRPRGWVSPYQGWRNDGDAVIPRNQDDCTHCMPLPPAPEVKP